MPTTDRRAHGVRSADGTSDDDYCPNCGAELDWMHCDECGGDGEINRYDDDPLWYDTEDRAWETCVTCGGHGGWEVCWSCKRGM